MYLQITTKCNMSCEHCCYACTKYGRHGDYNTILENIRFASNQAESISIGGGEPTLHPRFFDILKACLDAFDYVWLASNGSQTESMYRLNSIIENEDYMYLMENCDCLEDYSEEEIDEAIEEGYEHEYHSCESISLNNEDQLSVALSTDYYHDPIDSRILDLWTRKKYELRDVTKSNSGVIAAGRAKKTGAGYNTEDCVCADIFIAPTGKIKLCGCSNAPVIGNTISGIEWEWQQIIENDESYQDTRCHKSRNKALSYA